MFFSALAFVFSTLSSLELGGGESFYSAPYRAVYRSFYRPKPRVYRVVREETPQARWRGHFSAKNFTSVSEKRELSQIRKQVQTVMRNLPGGHLSSLKNLEVRNKYHVSRGMANSKRIILNIGNIDTDEELMAVFVHEIGHVVDLGHLKGRSGRRTAFYDGIIPIYADDPSLEFYQISWKNSTTRKKSSKRMDFVSGYALSNVFEDFAEHYLFYRLHGEKFRALAKHSAILTKKYDYMKRVVFKGKEFQTEKVPSTRGTVGIWDATLVAYDKTAIYR